MTWFKVDDNLAMHPKVLEAGNAALGLWVRAGSWSANALTNGFIPRAVARQFGTKTNADRLVNARLWAEVDGGYQFHEWEERQPSKDDVEEKRRRTREKVADYRKRKKSDTRDGTACNPVTDTACNPVTDTACNPVTDTACNPVSNQVPTRAHPDPTRPVDADVPLSAARSRTSTRGSEPPPRAISETFRDGVPIPPEPPSDYPPTRGALALVPADVAVPVEIHAGRPPARGRPSDAALTLVRSIVGRAVGRQIVDQLAREVEKLTRDRDVDPADIATALTEWANRPGAGPKLLPNLVADAARARNATNRPRPTSAISRGREYLEVGERLAQQLEAQQQTARKAIE